MSCYQVISSLALSSGWTRVVHPIGFENQTFAIC